MQGEVYVPYTGIGGMNLDSDIMTANLTGSTAPEVDEGVVGSTVNLKWQFPGGITNKTPGGVGWGYALQYEVECRDEDIESWLQGLTDSTRPGVTKPTVIFSLNEVKAAEDPRIAEEINKLMKRYAFDVLTVGQYDELRENYEGCVSIGD